jgi:hypothetical protein
VPSAEEQANVKKQKREALRQRLQERRQSDEMVMKFCLLGHIKDPYKETLRQAFRNDGDSCSSYVCNAFFGTDAFAEGDIPQRNAHRNSDVSGRSFQHDLCQPVDVWHLRNIEEK